MGIRPIFQALQALKDLAVVTPSGDALHLRMGGGADNDRKASLRLCPADDAVDALDEGTGGVDDLHALVLEALADGPADAVGADNHRLPGQGLLRGVDDPDPQAFKFLHHMVVVDDRSQGGHLFSRGCGLFHQLYRPADAEAEARALGHMDAHWATFFAMMSFMAAMTASISISEVSSFTASPAIFRGATARWVSWSSRLRISARIFS